MKIEEESLKRYPELDGYTEQEYHESCCSRVGFIEGAKWMLERAENWLRNHISEYTYYNPFTNAHQNECEVDNELFEHFKKAIE
jgi:hypothetical protein